MTPPGRHPPRDDGAAMLVALIAAAFVAALALAMVVVGETELRIEASYEWTMQTREAATAGAARVVAELGQLADWSPVVGGSRAGAQDPGPFVTTPGGLRLDLTAARADIQAESDARFAGSPNRPTWRLFESGPLERLVGPDAGPDAAPEYVAVWVADDGWDDDGDADADANGVVALYAAAWGPAGARAAVRVTLAHGAPQPGCVLPARSNYDSGRPGLSAAIAHPVDGAARAGPIGSGIVLAGWQGSDPGDPCRQHGPGLVIVTWREVV